MQKRIMDVIMEPLDWRYSASIVGMYKYLSFYGKKEGEDFKITEDSLEACSLDFTEEKYLLFVERYYSEAFPHLVIEEILNQHDISEEEKKTVNKILDQSNFTLKKIFKQERFNGRNKAKILSLIRRNRELIIRETFLNRKELYGNYANTNMLFKDKQARCRLKGYYVDGTRKSRADSYYFNAKTFVSEDSRFFDFIPFAFHGMEKTIFINNSFYLPDLIKTNLKIEKIIKNSEEKGKPDICRLIFQNIQKAPEFIDYDVEVILKTKEQNYFQTIYIRQESIHVLRKIETYDLFCVFFRINDHYCLNMQEEVIKCILNFIRTDALIDLSLKRKKQQELIEILIRINLYICKKDKIFENTLEKTAWCAQKSASKLSKDNVNYYKQQLITFLSYKDYEKCCQILLHLSDDTGISFDFIYDLIEDFEENKDIAYTFINEFHIKTEKL